MYLQIARANYTKTVLAAMAEALGLLAYLSLPASARGGRGGLRNLRVQARPQRADLIVGGHV